MTVHELMIKVIFNKYYLPLNLIPVNLIFFSSVFCTFILIFTAEQENDRVRIGCLYFKEGSGGFITPQITPNNQKIPNGAFMFLMNSL